MVSLCKYSSAKTVEFLQEFTEQVRQQGQHSFTSSAQDLYVNIMMKRAYMTRERGEDDGERHYDVGCMRHYDRFICDT